MPQISGDTGVKPWLFDLSPDGKTLAWTGHVGGPIKKDHAINDPVIRLWDTSLGKEIRTLSLADETVSLKNINYSPDGKFLASRDEKGVTVWEVAMGKALHRLQHKDMNDGLMRLAFSPDSRLLAFGDDTNTIFIYAVATGKEIRHWQDWHPYIGHLVFSPDGKSIASSGGRGNSISVWAIDSGKELVNLGGSGLVFCLQISPGGHMVATAVAGDKYLENGDKVEAFTIHLWDILTREEVRRIDSPQGLVQAMAFSADGRTLATGGADSTILLWDLTGHAENGKYLSDDLTAKDLNKLWADLASEAPQANRAMWSLALSPQQSLPFLKERLQPPAAAKADLLAKLLADLDSDRFDVRQKAAREVDQLAEAAEAALRQALTGNLPLESRQRIEQILGKRDKDAIRNLRAIAALEQIGPDARQVLQVLAKESPNPRVAQGATAALERMARRN